MGFLDKLFGREPSVPQDEGIYFYVRCNHCDRVLHTRLDPQASLIPRDEGGFRVRKEMMDDRCFRTLLLTAVFDRHRKLQYADVEGGILIDRETWEAEKNLPRRPPANPDDDLKN